MNVVGLVFAAIGAVLLALAEHRLAQANPTQRLPGLGSPPRAPWGALALRVVGAGLAVFGAVLAAPGDGWVAGLAVVVAWLPSLAVHVSHNRRVRAEVTRTGG